MKKVKETTESKEIKSQREKLDKFIENHNFDLSNEEVIKRSLETEKTISDMPKKQEANEE